jgi:ABC-type transporter Mla subunit MlaD
MRVRISYAVDTKNIIDEVQRLIEQAEDKIQNQIQSLHRARDQFSDEDVDRVIKQIDSTRKELTRYDQTLEDCSAILQGYSGLLKQQRQQGEQNADKEPEDG